MKLTEFSQIKKKNRIMTTLVMQPLKMEVEDKVVVLEGLVEQIFQIFLKIFLEILVGVEDQEIEAQITEARILRYDLSITLEEAYQGKKQDIKFSTTEKCNTCKGNGSKPGHSPDRCTYCGGNGKIRSNQGFFTVQQTCPQCNGNGEEITHPCNDCNGQGKKQASKKISVTIPKGVDDGTRIRLAGKGEAGSRGGATGDLYLFINVHSHELFKRSDENLFFEFPISLADAALGTTIEIPTIDGGKAKIKIPDGTQNGKQFRLKGKGMPFMRRGDFGDLYVQVKTEVPVYLNKKQKELLEQFREIENDKSNPSIKKFFQKAKDFWKN